MLLRESLRSRAPIAVMKQTQPTPKNVVSRPAQKNPMSLIGLASLEKFPFPRPRGQVDLTLEGWRAPV
jgi:hypothetical protein